jgi:hypothetical protein
MCISAITPEKGETGIGIIADGWLREGKKADNDPKLDSRAGVE